jgi:hypothetical protein
MALGAGSHLAATRSELIPLLGGYERVVADRMGETDSQDETDGFSSAPPAPVPSQFVAMPGVTHLSRNGAAREAEPLLQRSARALWNSDVHPCGISARPESPRRGPRNDARALCADPAACPGGAVARKRLECDLNPVSRVVVARIAIDQRVDDEVVMASGDPKAASSLAVTYALAALEGARYFRRLLYAGSRWRQGQGRGRDHRDGKEADPQEERKQLYLFELKMQAVSLHVSAEVADAYNLVIREQPIHQTLPGLATAGRCPTRAVIEVEAVDGDNRSQDRGPGEDKQFLPPGTYAGSSIDTEALAMIYSGIRLTEEYRDALDDEHTAEDALADCRGATACRRRRSGGGRSLTYRSATPRKSLSDSARRPLSPHSRPSRTA